ncbi:type II toxin-antitoxin system RelE/ParE family toxin [Erysipelotrichaceae bacterium RD49]|nr:type II toxin-antitoxin system RelE/ParE family toxin [Erysipelotrichaceae bacterium RD49]
MIHICYHKSMNNRPEFEFYIRPNGHNEFAEFLGTLPVKDKEKLMAVIYLVQEKGLVVAQRMKWVKKIDDDIYEIRSQVASNIQRALYFHVCGNRYVITHGFTKKTQKTPVSEINHAKMLKKEFEESDQNGNS